MTLEFSAIRLAAGSPRRQADVEHPRSEAMVSPAGTKELPVVSPCASGMIDSRLSAKLEYDPLSAIAPWNRPFAVGDAIAAYTLWPPADSPKIVTRFGSPPNPAMFF